MTTLIQIFVVIIIIGEVYSLWRITKAYGGLIGSALKWIGVGILFIALEALDRVLDNYGFVQAIKSLAPQTTHNIILMLSLVFSGIGFSKLTKISR